jgi:Zn-dependent protease
MNLYLGRYFNIPVYFNWSALILYAAILPTWSVSEPLFWSASILITAFLGSIVAHEFGHALAGRAYGYDTSAIYMWAAGGIADFNDIPDGTMKEFWISVAGPAVNLGIFLVIFLGIAMSGVNVPNEISKPLSNFPTTIEFWTFLAVWNLLVAGFNLLPMFPSDGGRILRSLLSLAMTKKNATAIAGTLGGMAGLAMVIFGIYNFEIVITAVGLFLIIGAYAEYTRI